MNVWFLHCPGCGQKSVAVGRNAYDLDYEGTKHRAGVACTGTPDAVVSVLVAPLESLALPFCLRDGHDWSRDERRCARCGGLR